MKSDQNNKVDFLALIALLEATLSLFACGDKQGNSTPAPAPVKLFEAQREALEKSKEVQQTTIRSGEELKHQEEAQSK